MHGGKPFGAVVVLDGKIVAQGVNQVDASKDPTAHAETVALRSACLKTQSLEIPRSTVFASGQPCVMCQSLAYSCGVSEMVFALSAAECAKSGWRFKAGSLELLDAWTQSLPGFTRQLSIEGSREPFDLWLQKNTF